jgi:hypothetical protein
MTTHMKSLTVALMLLVAALLPVTAAPASASNADNCRGRISSFYKSNGRVYLHYRVTCDRVQKRMGASSFLRRAASDVKQTRSVDCVNVSFCTAVASVRDKAGTQTYYARTDTSTLERPYTYAQRTTLVLCGSGAKHMTCAAGYKNF